MANKHLLVTNDFLPKVGGIQNYLYDLWSQLPSDSFAVYTTAHREAEAFDSQQDFKIFRSRHRWLGPYPWLARSIRNYAHEVGATHLIFDPAWPLGFIAPRVGMPYAVILHGAEAIIPSRLPLAASMFRSAVDSSELIIVNSNYPLQAYPKDKPHLIIPPAVDCERFKPLGREARQELRKSFAIEDGDLVISAVSRLVARKGFDVLIEAVKKLREDFPVRLLIAGDGKKRSALEQLCSGLDYITLLGPVADEVVVQVYQSSDVMAMICQERWMGLEQEGFGIVFIEAGACGVPQVAGRSGGSHEAVIRDQTGLIVDDPKNTDEVVEKLARLLQDPDLRRDMGVASREKALQHSRDYLGSRLGEGLHDWMSS